ncbi:Ubiquitin-like protein ATG12 isoform 3 [Scophthalmus maximus]|uniref:Ubiquitin-like protein ATG12 n=1 Tax=Scophthalmus maximus TaxID=52904 RepID=A0A2U9AXX7_SCOMX|nr:Ubiquitin-like protein ATG12 [Scophthalmus maximus]AWO96468.1 Ubiquitin-like protein ATG12 isoform 3 [Scophthalmus maximus]
MSFRSYVSLDLASILQQNYSEQFKFRFDLGDSASFTFIFSIFFTVDVLLKAVGDTPIMKTKKWAVERVRTIQSLSQFIARFLKLDSSEQLFIYVNQSFAPSPDQEVGILFDCFGSDGKLVLHYCKSQAWG